MEMKEMVIEVNGLPDKYSEDIMIDKLTIHFLRRSNKGGDILTVIYPTSNKGQAYVVFESEEVPGVLEHTHVLQVESQFYPLDVKQMDQPQLDMPAETFLDMNLFCRQKKIEELLYDHGFQLTPTRSGQLHLQGSFLKLQLIYPKLMQVLAEETRSQMTPSYYTNGFSDSGSRAGSYDYKHRSNVTSRYSGKNGSSVYAASRITSNSGSPESHKNMAFLQTASIYNGNSDTDSSFSSPSRNYETQAPAHVQRSSPRKMEDSFLVETDVLEYINYFKEDLIKKIQSDHSTLISYVSGVDSGAVTVKLYGGSFEEAAKELQELVNSTSSSLRTQEIDLNKLDSSHKKRITQKANSFQKIYTVLIRAEGHIIKVVGSSQNSYEAKQSLLEEKVDIAPPRPMERNLSRRSSSLPRQYTRQRIEKSELKQSADVVVISSSASHSQKDFQLQQQVRQERGRTSSKSTAQRGRSQSTTRSKTKNQSKVNQEPANNDQQKPTPFNEVQTSTQTYKKPLLNLDMSKKKFKWPFTK